MNVTDGRYVYMRKPVHENNGPLCQYTLMPTIMRGFKPQELLRTAELAAEPFPFTKGIRTLRLTAEAGGGKKKADPGHELYDLANDPQQQHSLNDRALEERITKLLIAQMKRYEAPAEQFVRLGLDS